MYQLLAKIKEALVSVLPVTLIVLILSFTPIINLTPYELMVFVISALILIIGIGLFNLGADIAMQPMGEQVGSTLIKTRKLPLILGVCFILGLLITIAEPDLSVLANQVAGAIDGTLLIITIGIGVAIFLVLSVLKIIFKKDLSSMLLFFYLMLFALLSFIFILGIESFLALGFDSGGVTTGPITVPFIMALGVGIAHTIGGKSSKENSFGLIALCSIGPILSVIILALTSQGEINYIDPAYKVESDFLFNFLNTSLHTLKEVGIALGLIVVFFLIINFIYLKLPKSKLISLGVGILYTLIGLVLFLTAVSVGFMPIGYKIGQELAAFSKEFLIVFGFILGCVVVLAEPAIHVLTKQVEEITTGGVSKKSMLIALCIGVGLAIGLSMIRIVFDFSILYYLIPGYLISLGLSFFVPKLYTAIAFDSGGVASGPLTSSFILPLAIGACLALHDDANMVLMDAFGIVAMVAMIPLISIQLLGFRAVLTKKVKTRIKMNRLTSSETDEKIIYFD